MDRREFLFWLGEDGDPDLPVSFISSSSKVDEVYKQLHDAYAKMSAGIALINQASQATSLQAGWDNG